MKEKSIDIVQKSQIDENRFNQTWFLELVKNLSPEDFNRFCKEIMLLHEYYDSSVGLFCIDKKMEGDEYFKLEPIDFDRPINFKRIE